MYLNIYFTGIIKLNAICFIAKSINTQWKILGGYLGLQVADIENIDADFHGIQDKALTMLAKWCKRNPESATLKMMNEALKRVERNDIITEITNMNDWMFHHC